jgi:ribosomal protein L12E/L44/L45/RPP1/RPP2
VGTSRIIRLISVLTSVAILSIASASPAAAQFGAIRDAARRRAADEAKKAEEARKEAEEAKKTTGPRGVQQVRLRSGRDGITCGDASRG